MKVINLNEAKKEIADLGIGYEIIGNGETVLDQTPSPSYSIDPNSTKIILYTEENKDFSARIVTKISFLQPILLQPIVDFLMKLG